MLAEEFSVLTNLNTLDLSDTVRVLFRSQIHDNYLDLDLCLARDLWLDIYFQEIYAVYSKFVDYFKNKLEGVCYNIYVILHFWYDVYQ